MRELAVLPAVIRHARQLLRDGQDTRAGRLLSHALASARVCAAQGLTFDAVQMRRGLLAAYQRYGPAEHIPHAWEKLAAALHTDGQCEQARIEVRDAFGYRQRTGIPGQPVGGQLLDTCAGAATATALPMIDVPALETASGSPVRTGYSTNGRQAGPRSSAAEAVIIARL
jgi:hypothetical protein